MGFSFIFVAGDQIAVSHLLLRRTLFYPAFWLAPALLLQGS
jgi:hypothetical protein